MKESTDIKTVIGVIGLFLAFIMVAALFESAVRRVEAERKEAEKKYNAWFRAFSTEMRPYFESHPHLRFNFEKTSQ